MYWSVDRIEENNIICENIDTGVICRLSADSFDQFPCEGDVFKSEGDLLCFDEEKTVARRRLIQQTFKKLIKK